MQFVSVFGFCPLGLLIALTACYVLLRIFGVLLRNLSDDTLDSANYGRHLTFEQVRKLVWDQEAIDAVHNFLAEHHIPADHTELAPNGEFIKVKAPIAKLEKMFDSEFHHFARYVVAENDFCFFLSFVQLCILLTCP